MKDTKIIFVAFAIEDERQRDFFKGQSLSPRNPYQFVDMSVKTPYPSAEWKEKVRTRIRRSDGVIALISENTINSSGEKWEIKCSQEEGKKLLGIWAYSFDRTDIPGVLTKPWNDRNVNAFIDSL